MQERIAAAQARGAHTAGNTCETPAVEGDVLDTQQARDVDIQLTQSTSSASSAEGRKTHGGEIDLVGTSDSPSTSMRSRSQVVCAPAGRDSPSVEGFAAVGNGEIEAAHVIGEGGSQAVEHNAHAVRQLPQLPSEVSAASVPTVAT